MTRIRNILHSFRIRRSQTLSPTESVSFEAFCNENHHQTTNFGTKESSLNNDLSTSPIKSAKNGEYVKFSANNPKTTNCTRPSLLAILLVIVLLAVLLILPLVYLLHCLGVLYIQERHNHYYPHTNIREQSHYQPSAKIHDTTINKTLQTIQPVFLPLPPKPDYNQCKILKEQERFDCFPEGNPTPNSCEQRGCCWIPAKTKPINHLPLNVPYCFYPKNYPTYNYLNITETAFGLIAYMKRNYTTPYPDDVEIIKMIVKFENENRLHVKILDPLRTRFEPPYPEVPIVDKAATNLTYLFRIDPTKTGFTVLRKSDNTVIFDTTFVNNLIFSNQFLQISSKLPSNYIYGLGEHRSNLLLSTNWSQFTLFNHDGIPSFNKNLYGSHPFYLVMENSGLSHGVFLLNSNAMDIILQPTPAITFRTIGGILDFYFFLGPKPSDVISQYTDVIGRPFMPPYWALGFHLCRFGYKTLEETKKVMERNINAGIPLDTQWNDLDYMNNSNDFTYDHKNFVGLPEFVEDLHIRGMHYIPLIDPGVSASELPGTYLPYDLGIKMDIFIKDVDGQPFIGKVWNRQTTVWPDFTNSSTVEYWKILMEKMHKQFQFDGAWIDMNEPSNFWSGTKNGCPKTTLEYPPYLPNVDGDTIFYKTVCMSAKHFAGLHYDVHNLYGLTETIVTSFVMSEIRGKRPMVISRSTFPGNGHFAGHWSGDVVSEWLDMKYTIPGSLNLFGIPLMGADICGFNGNTTRSLCNRWMQLGAFYPFSRNHNTDDGIDQDPVAMGPQVTLSSKKALEIRYRFLPYLYTLFWLAHTEGETVARPLFFEFPFDEKTYSVDTQFFWGPALMIIPVLEENATSVNAYVPEAVWYEYYTKVAAISDGEMVNLSAPIDTIPLFIRGGYILPQQEPEQTSTKSRKNNIEILVAPNEEGKARGQLYWDDGDSLNSYEEKRYSLITFESDPNKLWTKNEFWSNESPPNLGCVTVLGMGQPISEVLVNNLSQPFLYDTIHKFLSVINLNVSFKKPIIIEWK